mmetsp:Transcript_27546/g.91404  ORF Transcript_27546/g.91404 Transcript_27546/m.91404 type:complete len:425 (-) Transcript_27546:435-1709(-)
MEHVDEDLEVCDGSESKAETQARRENARVRQINIGKARPEYRRYIQEVPREKRPSSQPRTPDPRTRASKRQFDRELSSWRRHLHEWDTGTGGREDADAAASLWSDLSGDASSPAKTPASKRPQSSPGDGHDDSVARRISLADLFPASASPPSVLAGQAFGHLPQVHTPHPWQPFSPMIMTSPVTPAPLRPYNAYGQQQMSLPEGDETPDYKPTMPHEMDLNIHTFGQDKLAAHCGFSTMMMAPPMVSGYPLAPPMHYHPIQQLQLPMFNGGAAGGTAAPERSPSPPQAESSPRRSPPRTPLATTPRARSPAGGDHSGEDSQADADDDAAPSPLRGRRSGAARRSSLRQTPPPSVAKTPNYRFMVPETPSPNPYQYNHQMSRSGLNWPMAMPPQLPPAMPELSQHTLEVMQPGGGASPWGFHGAR